jgi:cobalamin-dependent methionine synthase-like protein
VDYPPADVRALFDEALALGRTLIEPRAVVRWRAVVHRAADRLDLGDVSFHIPDVGRDWGAIDHVAAAVITVGDAIERRVAALWDARELPLAMMLDSVASGAVESLAEFVNDLLCQQATALGMRATNRISPGYARWDVAEQRQLFVLASGDAIGVRLNEACYMTPSKSITLLVGAGADVHVDHYFAQCARCWMRDCAYRRAPARRTVHGG